MNPRLATRLASLVLIWAASARGAGSPPLPIYTCPKAEQRPVIDGTPDDAAWLRAQAPTGFVRCMVDEPFPVETQTSFRMVHDAANLYVLVECTEPEMAQVVMSKVGRDASVWKEDDVEVFVSSDAEARGYCQFCVSPRGTLFDAKGKRSEWNGAVEWAAARRAQGWCVEMRIPFQDIDLATPAGAVLRANVFRMRRAGGSGEPSGWSPVRRAFNDPSRFGYVLLGSCRAHLRRVLAREQGAFEALYQKTQAAFEKHPAIRDKLGQRVARVREQWVDVQKTIAQSERSMTNREWQSTYESLTDAAKELRQLGIKIEFEIVLE